MTEVDISQILQLMKDLQEENRHLREKIEELSSRNSAVPLSSLQSLSKMPLRQNELSSRKNDSLGRAVDMILQYAKATNFG